MSTVLLGFLVHTGPERPSEKDPLSDEPRVLIDLADRLVARWDLTLTDETSLSRGWATSSMPPMTMIKPEVFDLAGQTRVV
jgi:hypothetical protein